MRFVLMIEPQQGLSYGDQVAIAKRAEANGFEALFRSDHYASFPGPAGKPTTDAWTVLAGLARETERIGLGVLVSPVTFRHPGNFAKVVTTVDEMSGGRVEVGVGAGWNDLEHRQLRPAVPADRRARRPARGPAGDPPRPVGRAGRLVVRGPHGPDRGRALPAETGGRPRAADRTERRRRDRGSSRAAGARRAVCGSRPATRTSSTSRRRGRRRRRDLREARRCVPGDRARSPRRGALGDGRGARRPDRRRGPRREARAARRVRRGATGGEDWLEERRERWVVGTADQPRGRWSRASATAGVERIMLQDFLPWDLDLIDVMGETLVGQV